MWQKHNLGKKIEVAANIAIIVAGLALCAAITKKYLLTTLPNDRAIKDIKVGDKFHLNNVDWGKSKHNIVLVVQKGCHYCSESSSFYESLVKEVKVAGNDKARIIAVSPHPANDETLSYLNRINVKPDEIAQSQVAKLGLRGTPTIIFVDAGGSIEASWVGKLNASQEDEVISSIKR